MIHRLALVLVLSLALLGVVVFDCALVEVGITPLNDLGPGEYLSGVIGGL